MEVWNGKAQQWRTVLSQGCRALPDVNAIEQLAEKLAPLLDRVRAGHSVEWNGSNNVGRLTDDAQEASEEIDAILTGSSWTDTERQGWDASE